MDSDGYAVLTADADLNALGCGAPSEARVLFTTHRMVESRCMGRRFASVGAFHYRGEPRAVRNWDEAILPGQTLTIRRDDLAGLLNHFRGRHPQLADAIENLFADLTKEENGSVICLPDLADDHGVDLNDALALVSGYPGQEPVVEQLWFLFGKHATVRRDGAYGETILDYRDTLPEDIKPLIALDASARVRTVYDCWKGDRGGIAMLPGAPKRYDQLAVHVWERSGSNTGELNV